MEHAGAADKKPGFTRSLTKALAILETLADRPDGAALARIAERTGLNKSTAYRMLQTMQNIGYVEPGSAPGSYRLSFRIVAMGQKLIHGTNIIQIALPELKAVNEELGENEYGFACVAAPIFNHEGSVEYAVSVTMTTTKLQAESIETFARPLGKAAESISRSLGYKVGI